MSIRQSALLAADDLIRDNILIKWYSADSNCSADRSQAAAKKLINDYGVHVSPSHWQCKHVHMCILDWSRSKRILPLLMTLLVPTLLKAIIGDFCSGATLNATKITTAAKSE